MIRRYEWLKSAALFGISLVISFAIGELALRLLKPQFTFSRLVELAGEVDPEFGTSGLVGVVAVPY